MKTLTIEYLQERLTNAVLVTLDNEVKDLLSHPDARGWIDKELPTLLRGLHPHINAVALRINDGNEASSAYITINMGE